MATNQDGHLIDDKGNVAVDFVWGNFPLQPNDIRRDNGGSNLNYALDGHNIAEDGWNGYPLYTPNTTGTQSGGVDYVKVPNVLGQLTADATDTLLDSTLVASVQSAATNAVSTITSVARTGTAAQIGSTGAGAKYPVGTKITVASLVSPDTDLNGTWTVTGVGTNTVAFTTTTSGTLSTSGLSVAGLSGVAGTIKSQGTAAGTSVAVGVTVTTTPWAAAS